MVKVGLADTLKLLSAGYKKKDIDALAAIDEEQAASDQKQKEEAPAKHENQDDDKKKEDPDNKEPDYKKLYEELKAAKDETDNKLSKLQQDNVHKNSAPDAEQAKKEEQDALSNMVRSFM